jgi:hypothetical protein
MSNPGYEEEIGEERRPGRGPRDDKEEDLESCTRVRVARPIDLEADSADAWEPLPPEEEARFAAIARTRAQRFGYTDSEESLVHAGLMGMPRELYAKQKGILSRTLTRYAGRIGQKTGEKDLIHVVARVLREELRKKWTEPSP